VDLNIRHFILLMTAAAVAALFWLKPHHVTFIEKKGVPQIAFENFVSYEIRKRGVTDRLEGEKALKFGKKLIVERPKLRRMGERGEETVAAERAIFVQGRGIELKKDVRLSRSDGWKLDTSYLHYDFAKRLYSTGKAPFVITYGESVVHGTALRYDQKRGKIWARTIHAKIAEEDM
jgi:LPS export ABC transporter protein LptC